MLGVVEISNDNLKGVNSIPDIPRSCNANCAEEGGGDSSSPLLNGWRPTEPPSADIADLGRRGRGRARVDLASHPTVSCRDCVARSDVFRASEGMPWNDLTVHSNPYPYILRRDTPVGCRGLPCNGGCLRDLSSGYSKPHLLYTVGIRTIKEECLSNVH